MHINNIAFGQSVPAWAGEIDGVLRMLTYVTNRELAVMLCRPEPRVSEVVSKLERAGRVRKTKCGKEMRISLPWVTV